MATLPSVAICAHDWGWQHASRRSWAVRHLDLEIAPGERVLLLGSSGAGKSTLLRGLAGILGGTDEGTAEGTLTVDGVPAHEARGRVGMVLQDPDAQVILDRVGDDVAFGCENLCVPREQIWPRVTTALDAVGLDVACDRPTRALSGGQRQRMALAGVLAMQPGLILLDEPTANLDPDGVREVRDAVAQIVAEQAPTLVIVEHRVDVWADLATRVVVIDPAGGLLADGPPAEVFAAHADMLTAAGVWVPGVPAPELRVPEPGSDPILTGTDLVLGYDAAHPVRAVASVAIPGAASTTLSGPNGSGKTTLALTLAGLLPALSGTVSAADVLRDGLKYGDPHRWRSRELLTRMGVVFQNPEHQFVTGRVRDELAVGLRALKRTDVDARVEDIVERLHLTHLANANPFTLSGGEKRRLSVATVLVTSPKVLVLDEPTFGQDRATWAELVQLMADVLTDGCTLISSTHDAHFIEALGQHRIELA